MTTLSHTPSPEGKKEIPKSKRTSENAPIFSVVILGLVGIYFCVQNTKPVEFTLNEFSHSPIERQIKIDKPGPKVVLTKLTTFSKEENLAINGEQEVNQTLTFQINDWHQDVMYELDFGNEKVIDLNEPSATIQYDESGLYLVELRAKHKGQSKVIFSDWLRIYEAIEVDERATAETKS